MPKSTSVELGDEIAGFVAKRVASGRYEIVRTGLRLLQDEETRMAALHAALEAGEKCGEPVPLDMTALLPRGGQADSRQGIQTERNKSMFAAFLSEVSVAVQPSMRLIAAR